jgi:hypothetical protein
LDPDVDGLVGEVLGAPANFGVMELGDLAWLDGVDGSSGGAIVHFSTSRLDAEKYGFWGRIP